jgi:biopolymer transport protein ExbD
MSHMFTQNFPLISSKRRRGTSSTLQLRLTSMIDMMTILLVFLLKSYSTEGQISAITKDLRLPESTAQTSPRVTSVVSITSQWVLLDGRPIEKISSILSSESLLVEGLDRELKNLRKVSETIGNMSSHLSGFQGTITIQADRNITFDLLKRIMLTCGQVGYNNMMLAVLQKE